MTIAAVIPQTSHYVGYYTNYTVDGDQLWWDRNEKGEDEVIFLFWRELQRKHFFIWSTAIFHQSHFESIPASPVL